MQCTTCKPQVPLRLCVMCDSKLFGRSDKRFCTPKCKNNYHSELRKTNNSVSNETLKVLYKNYQILSSLLSQDCSKYQINKLKLERMGFEINTTTGIEMNKYGIKLKVFDFSWYLSKHNTIIVYHNPEESVISPFVFKRLERFGPIAN